MANPSPIEPCASENAGKPSPGFTISDVTREVPYTKSRTKECGDWPFKPEKLITDLVQGKASISDPRLQATLLDWIESAQYNKFLDPESGAVVYAQVAKRGNAVYATRKGKKRDALKTALDGKVFDEPVKGFRNRRWTRLLLCTVNFDRSKFSAEQAWASLRSTPIEGLDYTYNVINRLNANISKIFGKHGTLTSKEAQSSGYPAPHLIFILDDPVMVERHTGKDGHVSWRICDQRILNRIGKGSLMRKLARENYRAAIDMNPIWKHGFIDFEGIVSEEGSKSGRDAVTYPFKYLVKCLIEDGSNSIKGIPDINSVKEKDRRTMLFTHLGNKCFRTRDVSFGKGFKDRIGMLPEEKSTGPIKWERVRTMTDFEYHFIRIWEEKLAIFRFQTMAENQNGVAT